MPERQQPRVVIVDDDHAILLSYRMILERAGYLVTATGTSASAREILQQRKFDLLICDLSLDDGASGMDVIDVAVRRDPSLFVILMTGYADTELPPQFSRSKVHIVAKPANIPQLLDLIKELLDKKAQESQAAD